MQDHLLSFLPSEITDILHILLSPPNIVNSCERTKEELAIFRMPGAERLEEEGKRRGRRGAERGKATVRRDFPRPRKKEREKGSVGKGRKDKNMRMETKTFPFFTSLNHEHRSSSPSSPFFLSLNPK